MASGVCALNNNNAARDLIDIISSDLNKDPGLVRVLSIPNQKYTIRCHGGDDGVHIPALQWVIHKHTPYIMSKNISSPVPALVLGNDTHNRVSNKVGALANGIVPIYSIHETN
jgi:hypothetical protein